MKDIFSGILDWVKAGNEFAMATVISTWGSAPRAAGSSMVVNTNKEMLGSVSGGCVEAKVIEEAIEVMHSGQPRLLEFGVTNEDAWQVGLSCGGTIRIFVEPCFAFSKNESERTAWHHLKSNIQDSKNAILISLLGSNEPAHSVLLDDGQIYGSLPAAELQEQAWQALRERRHMLVESGGQQYFIQIFPRPAQLIILGAVDVATHLVELAKRFQFETIVIDPRGTFAKQTQFRSVPDQLHNKWPQEVLPGIKLDAYTFAVLLTHDPKIDDPALELLLQSEVAYIGALGGRKTQERRRERMREAGFDESAITRIHGPVGIDINARTAQEIALSIMAELIQVRNLFQK